MPSRPQHDELAVWHQQRERIPIAVIHLIHLVDGGNVPVSHDVIENDEVIVHPRLTRLNARYIDRGHEVTLRSGRNDNGGLVPRLLLGIHLPRLLMRQVAKA